MHVWPCPRLTFGPRTFSSTRTSRRAPVATLFLLLVAFSERRSETELAAVANRAILPPPRTPVTSSCTSANADVTAASCSCAHPVSSAASRPPAARCANLNTPCSFDRLYGLIILNIYGSRLPKPSMFIQHLAERSVAPLPRHAHTSSFSPSPLLLGLFSEALDQRRDGFVAQTGQLAGAGG